MSSGETRKRKLPSPAEEEERCVVPRSIEVLLPSLPEVLAALAFLGIPDLCRIIAAYCNTILVMTETRVNNGLSDEDQDDDKCSVTVTDIFTRELVWSSESDRCERVCFAPGGSVAVQRFRSSDDLWRRMAEQLNVHSTIKLSVWITFIGIREPDAVKVGQDVVLGRLMRDGYDEARCYYERVGDFHLLRSDDERGALIFGLPERGRLASLCQASSAVFHQSPVSSRLLVTAVSTHWGRDRPHRRLFQAEVEIGESQIPRMKLLCLHEMRDETQTAFLTRFPWPMLVLLDQKNLLSGKAWKLEFDEKGVLKQKFEHPHIPFKSCRNYPDSRGKRGPIRATKNEIFVLDSRSVQMVKHDESGVEVLLLADSSTNAEPGVITGAKAQFEIL